MAQSSLSSWDKVNISTHLQPTDSTSSSTKTSRERKLQFKNLTNPHHLEQEPFLFSSGSVHLSSMQKESKEVSSRYSSTSWRTSTCLMVHREEAWCKTNSMVVAKESKLVVLVKEDTSRTIEVAEVVARAVGENPTWAKEAVCKENLRAWASNILNSLIKLCQTQWEWCRTLTWHQSKLLWWDNNSNSNNSHKLSWI